MAHRFAVVPAGAVSSVEEANALVCSMCAGAAGKPASGLHELVDALPDGGLAGFSVDRPADSLGVIISTEHPENGPLRYLLSETKDRDLAVYDIELFRLYDPRGRVDIDVTLSGDVTLPYLTRALLQDIVIRPSWPSPAEPFVVMSRSDDEFIQVWRESDGTYQVEHRDGGPDAHFEFRTADVGLVVDITWRWVSRDPGWRTGVAWSRLDVAEPDDQDSWRPNIQGFYLDENSDREIGFDVTGGVPFLAYHAGNPANDKDADGRLVPLGWVLHLTDDEHWVTGVLSFDDLHEAATKAEAHVKGPTPNMPRRVSLRNERRDDGSWLNLDASLGQDGSLRITGQDFGPVTRTVSSDGEYEYFYTVAAQDVPALAVALGGHPHVDILELLKLNYCGDASYALERDLECSGVNYHFTSYC